MLQYVSVYLNFLVNSLARVNVIEYTTFLESNPSSNFLSMSDMYIYKWI